MLIWFCITCFFFVSFLVCLRLFQHTFGTHPQTFTNRLLARGLPGVCSGGVLQFSWTMVGCLIEVRDKRCVFHHQAIDAGDTAGMQRHLQSAKVAENARNFDGSVETKTNPRSLFVYNTSRSAERCSGILSLRPSVCWEVGEI